VGRTNRTFRDAIETLRDRWATYRRGLRRRDQAHFDRLFDHAREYADAAGYLNRTDAAVPLLFSIALAQERRAEEREDRIDGLEDRLDRVEDRLDELDADLGRGRYRPRRRDDDAQTPIGAWED
jgi:hypothetical protein